MEIIISGTGMEVTDPIRSKVREVIDKQENLLTQATKFEAIVKKISEHEGKQLTVAFEVIVHLPKTILRIQEKGEDLYVVIDQVDTILRRKLVQYQELKHSWEKESSWKEEEALKSLEVPDDTIPDENYESEPGDVTHQIVKRKRYSDNTPIDVNTAISKMELIGHNAFLFKNAETGKYTMVYKQGDGYYGLVEPKYTEEEFV